MSATLKALTCREILEAIFEVFSPGRVQQHDFALHSEAGVQRRLAQRTLARAARVCRAFEDPALNVLWRVVDDIVDLLRILPALGGYPYTFTREITEEEWTRFQEYLVRVRVLDANDFNTVEAFTWTVLRRWCPDEPLLPLLHRLSGFAFDDIGLSHTMLLTPMICDIAMVLNDHPSQATVKTVLAEMMPALSQIRSLSLSGDPNRIDLIPVWTFVQLRSLSITYPVTPTVASLNALLTFPYLSYLRLNLAKMADLAGNSLSPGFEALRYLALSAAGLSDVATFLEITKPAHLHSFHLDCYKFLADTTIETAIAQMDFIYSALPSCLLHFSAEFRVARDDRHIATAGPGGPTAAQLLEPLRSRNDMHTISFRFEDMYVGFTEDDLNGVQTLWPSLRTFQFKYGDTLIYNLIFNFTHASPFPSLASVASFVSAHPQLEALAIPSMSLPPLPDLDSLPSPPNPRLRRLRVPFFLPGPSLVKLGLLVDRLYPNLDLTDIRSTLDTGGYQRGQQFDLLLFGLQAGRRGAYLLEDGRLDDLGLF
ncbi:hypothetical protein K466DRAFT_113048 [Polyporus arcularius HHB13444]|uniref:F-box domain-containing protein n=1 Tax=Polyporus arcularius HHB13444 TaxID=1314778 RepID=A0A5C3PDS4_9APHY|nr:hypothetical protein K466DRAFT_113048 [Polyporus arcularius HHB13444]